MSGVQMHRPDAGGLFGVMFAVVLALGATAGATEASAGTPPPPLVQLAKLRASDGAALDSLGASNAISGNTIVVGAPGHGAGGAVYVFERPRLGWRSATESAKLTPSDPSSARFGESVAISGDAVVVADPFADVGVANSGAAYLFERPSGGWTDATQTAKLTASDGTAGAELGSSVSVSGDSVLVGAHLAKVGPEPQGAAYAFIEPVGGWTDATEQAKLVAAEGVQDDLFGRDVSIAGDTAAVGAPFRNVAGNDAARGIAYVFVAPAGPDSWVSSSAPNATLVASEGAVGDFLGFSIATSGETVVAGAMQDDSPPNDVQGSGYVFERPPGGWAGDLIESVKLLASDGDEFDRLGLSAAISGDSILLGASAPGMYLFEKPGTGWLGPPRTETAKVVADDAPANSFSGVAMSGRTILGGAPGDPPSGSAYVFGPPKVRSRTTLRVSTRRGKLTARGRVAPPQPGERVVVALFRKEDRRFRRLAAKRPSQRETGRFRASFARPEPGRCKMVARYRGSAVTKPSRATKRLAC